MRQHVFQQPVSGPRNRLEKSGEASIASRGEAGQARPSAKENLVKDWLTLVAENVVIIIHAMALVIIAIGTLQAFLRSVRVIFSPAAAGTQFHNAYLQYARWLVSGLTFQLAADIIESSIAPGWDEIGRLGAIALIRTFLNFFLERDLAEMERREFESRRAVDKSP
jgi:uncharacterized membrane protein